MVALILLASAGLAQPVATPGQDVAPPVAQRAAEDAIAPNFRLAGSRVVLPIRVIKGFPFIEATINGVHGKLMLDTGAKAALSLNHHRLPFTTGIRVGGGFFGSGQTFDVFRQPKVAEVRIGDRAFRDVANVETQDARMLEGITPDFLGWIGFDAWTGYALELDYRRAVAIFHRYEPGHAPSFLAGRRPLAIVRYRTPKLPNQPVVTVRIGQTEMEGAFDTGQFGALWIDPEVRGRLTGEGKLVTDGSAPEGRQDRAALRAVRIAGVDRTFAMPVDLYPAPFPGAVPIGLTSRNVLTFGYGLLSQYRSVWDFRGRIIYLLPR